MRKTIAATVSALVAIVMPPSVRSREALDLADKATEAARSVRLTTHKRNGAVKTAEAMISGIVEDMKK